MMTVHSVTRGWQDICVLLGMMGYMQPPIPCLMEGCPVTSSIHVVPSFIKNLPQKAVMGGAHCIVSSAPACLGGVHRLRGHDRRRQSRTPVAPGRCRGGQRLRRSGPGPIG